MKKSKHAKKRIRQRGFSNISVELICQFGRHERALGGAEKIILGKKEYQKAIQEFKRIIQILDKAKNGKAIIINDDLITVYH